MLKIKKFKIATHSKEILRKVIHGKIDIAEAGFASNSDVQDFAQELADKLDNGVVYQTFEKEDIAFDGIDLENNEIFSGAIITLGKDIETELEKLTNDKQIVIANIAIMEFLKTFMVFLSASESYTLILQFESNNFFIRITERDSRRSSEFSLNEIPKIEIVFPLNCLSLFFKIV